MPQANRPKSVVKIVSPVLTQISSATASLIRPALSFTKVYYKNGPFGRKLRKEYPSSCLLTVGTKIFFHTGLIPHISNYLSAHGNEIVVTGNHPTLPYKIPELPGITFDKEQIRLIESFLTANPQRGILKGFTGMGKTLIGIAICKAFSDVKIVWLCHTIDLMNQAAEELERFGFSVGKIGDGHSDIEKQVTVATRQSFSKIINKEIGEYFDVAILDEVHHLTDHTGQYGQIFSQLKAPVRLGLTATTPDITQKEKWLAMCGLIGPILDEFTIHEGLAVNRAAKPKIKLLRVPKSEAVKELRKYADVYQEGIVERTSRNTIIAQTIQKHIKAGESVLVLITHIEHGYRIQEACQRLGFEVPFVHGKSTSEERSLHRKALDKKEILCLIASTIFKEGVNIRSLDVILNAAGGKSEIPTLQAIGRGLRTTESKNSVIIYDFFDPSHRYLIEHFGERMLIYFENGFFE